MQTRETLKAIAELTNNAEYIWRGEDLKDIEWVDKEVVTPTQKQIDDKIKEMKASEEATKAAVEAKLAALGLTVEDLRFLL